jgi:hypothetical protein
MWLNLVLFKLKFNWRKYIKIIFYKQIKLEVISFLYNMNTGSRSFTIVAPISLFFTPVCS